MDKFIEGFLGSALTLGFIFLLRLGFKWFKVNWKSMDRKKNSFIIIVILGILLCLIVVIPLLVGDWNIPDVQKKNKNVTKSVENNNNNTLIEEKNIEEVLVKPSTSVPLKGLEKLTEEVKNYPRDSQVEFWNKYEQYIENNEDQNFLKIMIKDSSIYWGHYGNFGGDYEEFYEIHERTKLLPGRERPTLISLMFQMYSTAKNENADGILNFNIINIGSTEDGKNIFNVMGTLVRTK